MTYNHIGLGLEHNCNADLSGEEPLTSAIQRTTFQVSLTPGWVGTKGGIPANQASRQTLTCLGLTTCSGPLHLCMPSRLYCNSLCDVVDVRLQIVPELASNPL